MDDKKLTELAKEIQSMMIAARASSLQLTSIKYIKGRIGQYIQAEKEQATE